MRGIGQKVLESRLAQRFAERGVSVAVVLPNGQRLGDGAARVALRLSELTPLLHLAAGQIGRLAIDHVEGRLEIDGSMRDLMAVAAALVDADPTRPGDAGLLGWWRGLLRRGRSLGRHSLRADARQVRHHYDVSDEFYALWLDPRRVYSCAYFREADLPLAQAQEAKLDHVCRKLMLRAGERFLDVGCGWGGLLLWAAEHYGVRATGITLSRNQHSHVQGLIERHGLAGRVEVRLMDYRELSGEAGWDKVASIGMFEHVGLAGLERYFGGLRALLRPGGLLMNHGITAGGTDNRELGAGIGEFIERYIFPGGELPHLSRVLRDLSRAGLEALDVENLRPHYARTLWAWSDALEARLERARTLAGESVVRAYRLYLAGCAMSFERGWISLHQVLAARPSGRVEDGPMRGAQSDYPFQRDYMVGA